MTRRARVTLLAALALASASFSAWLTPRVQSVLPAVAGAPPAEVPLAPAPGPSASPEPEAPAASPAPAAPATPGEPQPPRPQATSTLDQELTSRVERVLEQGHVKLGHVIVMEPGSARVLASVSTDPERFPPTRTYPAASLIKVVTAAAALDRDPSVALRPCVYSGSPYRLTRARIDPPRKGTETTLRKALALSNNQCFAQLAVHTLGANLLLDAIGRFGLLDAPAPGYEAGSADAGSDLFDLGKLGCGLGGTRITPLHAAQLAGVLADGNLREPRFTEEAPTRAPRRVMTPELAAQLRQMLVDTTARGTARRAFRDPRGRPLLGSLQVAGKTGSLSGRDPDGRYEWFMGVAPAEDPEVAVAVVVVQGQVWWRSASQVAAAVFKERYCPDRRCP